MEQGGNKKSPSQAGHRARISSKGLNKKNKCKIKRLFYPTFMDLAWPNKRTALGANKPSEEKLSEVSHNPSFLELS